MILGPKTSSSQSLRVRVRRFRGSFLGYLILELGSNNHTVGKLHRFLSVRPSVGNGQRRWVRTARHLSRRIHHGVEAWELQYIYSSMCIYADICIYMYVHTYIYVHIHTCSNYTYMYMCICMYVCADVCLVVHLSMYMWA